MHPIITTSSVHRCHPILTSPATADRRLSNVCLRSMRSWTLPAGRPAIWVSARRPVLPSRLPTHPDLSLAWHRAMSVKTRNRSSSHLSDYVGSGRTLLASVLPTARDLLRLGIHLMGETGERELSVSKLCQVLLLHLDSGLKPMPFSRTRSSNMTGLFSENRKSLGISITCCTWKGKTLWSQEARRTAR